MTLSGPSGKAISLANQLDPSSTALVGLDFGSFASQFPTIPATSMLPGQTSLSLNVTIIEDNITEGNETIVIDLVNPINATLSATASRAVVTIIDNENAPLLDLSIISGTTALTPSNGVVSVMENAGALRARATLSNPSANTVTADVIVGSAATALRPVDASDLAQPSSIARLYAVRNGSMNPGTVTALILFCIGLSFFTET